MAEIHQAVEDSDLRMVKKLVKDDASNLELPDGLGNRPLHLAVQNDQAEMTKLLLKLGADVNSRGDMQRTPMHFVPMCGAINVARLLASHCADLGPIDFHRFTPLLYSVHGGGDGSGIDKILLEPGSPVDLNSAV